MYGGACLYTKDVFNILTCRNQIVPSFLKQIIKFSDAISKGVSASFQRIFL